MSGIYSAITKPGVAALSTRKASITITRLKPEDDSDDWTMALQYWPEEFSDSQGTNYQKKVPAGASLPIYAWLSGAERTLSFTVQLSTDVDLTHWVASPSGAANTQADIVNDLKHRGCSARNVDLRTGILWLRSLRMPTYADGGQFMRPPRIRLRIPGSRMGIMSGLSSMTGDPDAIICVMMNCETTWQVFFPNGNLRKAQLAITVEQVAQFRGLVHFPGYTQDLADRFLKGANGMAPWTLRGT